MIETVGVAVGDHSGKFLLKYNSQLIPETCARLILILDQVHHSAFLIKVLLSSSKQLASSAYFSVLSHFSGLY